MEPCPGLGRPLNAETISPGASKSVLITRLMREAMAKQGRQSRTGSDPAPHTGCSRYWGRKPYEGITSSRAGAAIGCAG